MIVARMKKRADFVAVQTSGRSRPVAAFVILALPGGDSLSIGYTASKKLGNAPQRNRAKRRMRAAVAEVAKTLPGLPCGRVVLVARQAVLTLPFPNMVDTLKGHLPEILQ